MYWIFFAFIILSAYFFGLFVVLRLVAPFMGFTAYNPPSDLPPEMKQAVGDLERHANGQMSYLQSVYDLVMQKNRQQWNHSRGQAARRLPRLFLKDLNQIWQTKDFVYCTAINYVVYSLLVNSKFFQPADIRVRHVFVNFVIHQYLQVRIGSQWIDVDPAGTGIRGKPLGTHLRGFG